jgi:hypothetical protein
MLDKTSIRFFKLAVGNENIGKESDLDIEARCPVCGDSQKNKRKKRLHLYTKSSWDSDQISCFNGDCGVHNKTVYSFLRDFFPALLQQFKKENFSNTVKTLSGGGDVFAKFKPKKKELDILTQDLSGFFTPIDDSEKTINYLQNRGIYYDELKFNKWFYGHQDLKIGDVLYKLSNSIIIPLYYNKEMYGFYSRNIENKLFCTYMNDSNTGYKVWYWFNIDKSKQVFIYEGIFDAISGGLENSIALMGAKLSDERLKELDKPVFVLDNDRTGLMNSMNYTKKGIHVYIQPSLFKEKDMNELMLNNPKLNIPKMIKRNLFTGITAEIRIKHKL